MSGSGCKACAECHASRLGRVGGALIATCLTSLALKAYEQRSTCKLYLLTQLRLFWTSPDVVSLNFGNPGNWIFVQTSWQLAHARRFFTSVEHNPATINPNFDQCRGLGSERWNQFPVPWIRATVDIKGYGQQPRLIYAQTLRKCKRYLELQVLWDKTGSSNEH